MRHYSMAWGEAHKATLCLGRGQIILRRLAPVRCANMHPMAVKHMTEQGVSRLRRIINRVQGKSPVGQGIKKARLENLHAGENMRRRLFRAPRQTAVGMQHIIAIAVIAAGVVPCLNNKSASIAAASKPRIICASA